MQTDKLLYRVDEAAQALGLSRARLYQLIAAGEVPAIRVGGAIRLPAEHLRKWIHERLEEQRRGAQ
jgi:excisionase family DNA binding protein